MRLALINMKFHYVVTLIFTTLMWGAEDPKWSPNQEQAQFTNNILGAIDFKPSENEFVFNEDAEFGFYETDSEVTAVTQVLQECNCNRDPQCTFNLEQVVIETNTGTMRLPHFLSCSPFIKPKILSAILFHCRNSCDKHIGTPLHVTTNSEITEMLLRHSHINVYDYNGEGCTALEARRSDTSIIANQRCIDMISKRVEELNELHIKLKTTLVDSGVPRDHAGLIASFITGRKTSK